MFSKSFNISDVVEKKSNLKHVSETTITQLDGSRYIQNNQNGSLSELASGSKDEDGQWADLDEAEALGLSATGDFSELHGHLGNPAWDAPTLASYSNTPARAGYNTEKGHEYLDSPEVLKEKVKVLASMLVKASKPVIYAGAGLSTASGIKDYATQTGQSGVVAQNGNRVDVSKFCASPNFGHHCIAALSKRGLVHRFVQQNHDGLPQKAGMSQGLINEIHGGWFDPSNPEVPMSADLRPDLFDDLLKLERETDLVIAVGSSLCGMNSDRLVDTSARKARTYRERMATKTNKSNLKEEFGSVIIALQKTVHDHNSSLRIFALIDDVFKLLAEEMKLDLSHLMPSPQAAEDQKEGVESSSSLSQEVVDSEQDHVFSVPFNEQGLPIGINEPNQNLRKLDLNDGALLTITDGPDKGAKAVVIGRDKDGHYRLSIESTSQNSQESETRLLGRWWPQNAIDGEVSYIPVVNRTSA